VLKDGAVESMTIFSRNITEAQRRRSQREEFFRLSRDLLCVLDKDGSILKRNPSFDAVLGHGEEVLSRRTCLDLVHPDDVETVRQQLDRLLGGADVEGFEIRCEDKDGHYHFIEWRVVLSPEEQLIYAAGRDITARRKIEERLLQSQKLDAVGQLAGGVAHDFNNLMLAVILNAESALAEAGSAALQTRLGDVLRAAERASELSKQLLAFSKADVGDPVPLDLRDIATALPRLLRRLVPETIAIEISTSLDPVVVDVDRGQIEQVIINLCLNASDAMPDGGTVWIEVGKCRDNGQEHASLVVRDNGCGMSEEVLGKIFTPFFSTKERGQGVGLGLATVYMVVKRHRGQVDVRSEEGEGTRVSIILPLTSVSTQPAQVSDGAEVLRKPEATTILVAEDDLLVSAVVTEMLEDMGYKVIVAANGEEAIELARDAALDAALLDLVMPKMSGYDAYEKLREQNPGLPVVFTTGYSDGALPPQALEAENVRLLRKPYRGPELFALLDEVLRR
jgi:PAS domain S-box-containing protein